MPSINPYLLAENDYPLAVLMERFAALRASGVDVLNLTMGDPEDDTYETVMHKLREEVSSARSFRYPRNTGEHSYLESVCSWAKHNHQLQLEPDVDLISCNGSKEAIFSIPLAFDWSDQKHIAIPSLSYPVYAASSGILGLESVTLSLSEESNFLPDLDSIPDSQWNSCGLIWINSPHNPTTTIASQEYLAKLLGLAEKFGFFVCSDECYNDLYYGDTRPLSCLDFPESDRWVVFRSLSKRSHMTGFRCGAIISKNRDVMKALHRMRQSMGVGTPTFVQIAAREAWLDELHCEKLRAAYLKKRDVFTRALNTHGFHVFGGEAGFYLWLSHPQLQTSAKVCEWFLNAGLLVTPGTAFGSDGEGYARLVYCLTDSNCYDAAARIEASTSP